MNQIYIPEGYRPILDAYDTQRAIAYIKKQNLGKKKVPILE